MKIFAVVTVFLLLPQATSVQYPWKQSEDQAQTLALRIKAPAGYTRVALEPGSFGAWLRQIPLKPGKPDVHLYNGQPKSRQDVHVAVVDIDVGTKDLQQCADAVIRLRAEYLYSKKDFGNLHFNFTNGFLFDYDKWRQGHRVKVTGNNTTWVAPSATRTDESYSTFKKYLDMAFSYCGTMSLAKEMKPTHLGDVVPGDVFIRGGSPGHAVIVMDVATNTKGEKVFLLGQSYMPAQEFHVLKNPGDDGLSPWYKAEFVGQLTTPEWVFEKSELRAF
jgi:hypothetical protein